MKRIFLVILFFCSHTVLSAQLTYGTTGLLSAPSADMQADKTVLIGGNFLNSEITHPRWSYHTFNYYLNATIFPFFEVAYTCTAFKGKSLREWLPQDKFVNQDRYFSARLRLLSEGQFWKYMPAVVFGASDPFSESQGGEIASTAAGNGYFGRFYLAATKHFDLLNKDRIGVHISGVYHRDRYSWNPEYEMSPAGGVSYTPHALPALKVIAEYDSEDFAFGASYLFFNHLHAQVELQKMKYITAGLAYKIYLK